MALITVLSTFMFILMVASLPYVQSSRALSQAAGTTLRADPNEGSQGLEINRVDIFGNGDSVLTEDEESARQVPTGPDPLHHNNNPIRP
ncbi:hypothetical protein PanWU01x14_085270 [Parasponia andersonii]|uniref:CLAVATA3/ESR (CLE)-related protein n=1 Tax=Parasponia andersonii TaxID=3476 RepID=A0A2P5D8W4_PARAD|nr:hypothetical protein PanWU01x14_085270 [Parasponia andersonii]